MNEPLRPFQKWGLGLLSFIIVAFGQPVWSSLLGYISACVGFALFFRILLDIPKAKTRFWLGFLWYGAAHMLQLEWMLSHPFYYIYALVAFIGAMVGTQFGILSIFITRSNLSYMRNLFALSGLWVLMEWMRLFLLSGYSWNPVGMAMTGYLYPLQAISYFGLFGLSFWVILTNLLALRAWISFPKITPAITWSIASLLPIILGFLSFTYHSKAMSKESDNKLSALLVQTSFPIEESMQFKSFDAFQNFVFDEWKHILTLLAKADSQNIDLIVLPEYVVPFGTYYAVYPQASALEAFTTLFGEQIKSTLPPAQPPYAMQMEYKSQPQMMVSNAFFAQGISNIFNAPVVIGLEDTSYEPKRNCYSSAFFFQPFSSSQQRYEKRVLVPMGEYIPFEWCKDLAAKYGIGGSFTCGTEAKVFNAKIPFGLSICYEETYGNLMRESRAKGAQLLVNLTNDAWYPHSNLPQQHFDHGRLRAVESGIPLIRACNTGITGAVDSLGRTIKILEENNNVEDVSAALRVDVPLYHYQTLYSRFGDLPIILISFFSLIFLLIPKKS